MKYALLFTITTFSAINIPAGNGFGIHKQHEPVVNLRRGLAINDKSKILEEGKDARALSFGYCEFDGARMNNYLNSASVVNTGFTDYNLGIALDNITNNGKHWDGVTSLAFILPQKISAGPADSLRMKLGGWHWTTSMFGYDVVKGEVLTLALAPAVAWGNLKIRKEVAGVKTKYTNPFVAPGGRGELRLNIGNFIIGARITYRYDITHSLWKRKDGMMPVLPEYENTGLAYFGYIGFAIGSSDDDKAPASTASPGDGE